MPLQKEEKVFFILAVLIILIGHQFLQGDNFLTAAGATKTAPSKTSSTTAKTTTTDTTTAEKTTTDTTSTDTTKTTETEPVEKIITPDTTTKTEISTTEKTITPTTTEKTPLAGKAAASMETKETNQTAFTKTTTTMEKEVVIKEFIPTPTEEKDPLKTESRTLFTTTKIVLENKGTTTLALIPTIKTTPFFLPNEENLNRLIREKIQAGEGLISAQELAQKTEKKVAGIKAIEKAKVKPLYLRKVYRPLEKITGQSVSDITYTGQTSSGNLLSPQLMEISTIMLPPQEQATIDLAILEPLAIEEQTVDISFSSQGQEVVSSKLHFPKSKTGTAIDIHPERHLFDLYVVINPMEKEELQKRGENYYVELVLKKGDKVTYFELLGPYRVKSTEPTLFSQEFRYPSEYVGKFTLITKIYQDSHLITTQEHQMRANI